MAVKKKKRIHSLFLLILVLMLPGCGSFTHWFGVMKIKFNPAYRAVKQITIEQLKERMDDPDVLIVNVLSQESYDNCHIAGSFNVPLSDLIKALQKWDKNQEIVLYSASCSCPISYQAYLVLKEHGFTSIEIYAGGMKECRQQELSCVGACTVSYVQ